MPKRQSEKLTGVRLDRLPVGEHGDGDGLALRVKASRNGNTRQWVLRQSIDGKRVARGLGTYPDVKLTAARAAAAAMRDGVAPEPPAPALEPEPDTPTFRAVAYAMIEAWEPTWTDPRAAKQWRAMFERYAFPIIGGKAIADVSPADITRVLEPIWLLKRETANRMKQRLSTVFDYALGHGYCQHNPVPRKIKALPARPRQRKHFDALPYSEVPAAVATIRDSGADETAKCALEFLVLTAARSGDVRGATWGEIDGNLWTIPDHRHKTRKEFQIPLSRRALEVARECARFNTGNPDDLVFPNIRTRKPLSDMVFTQMLRRLEIQCVAHGFRSSFKDWCIETGVEWAVSERALSHQLGDAVAAAYARSALVEQRRDVMEAWADFIS